MARTPPHYGIPEAHACPVSPREVADFIRGMTPFPGAWTTLNGATMKIKEPRLPDGADGAPTGLIPGQCQIEGDRFWVGTAGGSLEIVQGQFAGKPFLPVIEILRGYRFPVDSLGTDGH